MSIRFAAVPHIQDDADDRATSSSSDSEDYTEEDNNFEDWTSDREHLQACRSLFEDKTFTTAAETLKYDKSTHGFDLDAVSKQWSTSFLACSSCPLKLTFNDSVRSASSNTTNQLHP